MRGDFWSKRRAAVEAEAEAEVVALQAAEAAEAEAALDQKDDADILEEMGLPEPEALESPEAVREFMASAVPQRLKTRALRRLWRLNPVLANLDGLIDYGEDFTDSAMVIENLQTAYQVGKGMLKHVEELAKAEAKEEVPDQVRDTVAPEDEVVQVAEVEVPDQVLDTEVPEVEDIAPEVEQVALAPRRMQFRFEEHA